MDYVKSNLKGVIGSRANGIPISQIENDYYNLVQTHLDYKSLGFSTLLEFLKAIPDVVNIEQIGGKLVIKVTRDNNSPKCLTNIYNLVNKNSIKKNKSRDRNGRQQHISSNSQKVMPFRVLNENRCLSSGGINNSVIVNNNEKKYNSNYSSSSSNTNSEELFDSGTWFVRPEIYYEAFQKQVRILGIQCGHAVVVGSDSKDDCVLVQSKNVRTVFPGTIVLWQPPFNDNRRTPNVVDFSTCFPVTIIRRVNKSNIYVRVMGLVTMLEVSSSDLFEMPSSADQLVRLVRHILTRKITMVSLALIPDTCNVWDSDSLPGVYTVLYSIDEGGSIVEASDERGIFLNLLVLRCLRDQMVHCDDQDQRLAFLSHMRNCVDRSMDSLSPYFDKLMAGFNDVHPIQYPLRVIYNMSECRDCMLLGCKNALNSAKDLTTGKQHHSLSRMQAGDSPLSFFGFDDLSSDMSVEDLAPFVGVYIINDRFTESSSTDTDTMRFRTAMLIKLPSMVDLATDLDLCGH